LVRVVSYRLIDDAAGSRPPSIQEATTGNRERGKSRNDATKGGSGLDGGEPISGDEQDEHEPESVYRDTQGIGSKKHRPQYGIERWFEA
jgi:hypothetical protein